jgi:threonine dehydrogenase-like Zn-dependent dehydrogenase
MRGTVAVLAAPREIELREYEVVPPETGEILMEILRANVCGSELHIWRGHHPTVKMGSVLGHEMLGRVHTLGRGVDTDYTGQPLRTGDRVVCAYFITCRKCPACQTGRFNLCENCYRFWSRPAEAPPHFHGAFGTHYYIHPDQYVYKVPESVPDASAASANCALSELLFALDQAGLSAGEQVVVQGAGGLGLCALAVAKERGARTIVIDGVPRRLDQARRFGADAVVDMREDDTPARRASRVQELTGGAGGDVAVEVTGVPAAFSEAVLLVRPGGRVVELGNISPGHTTPFDPGLLTRRSVQILPAIRYHPWYLKRALDFLEATRDRYPFAALLDAEYPLEDVGKALEDSDQRKVTRASLIPNR